MAEISAFMFTTRKHFLALDQAKMLALRITCSSTKLFLDRAANLFTNMLIA
jgi:hypothetical protein